MLQAIHERKIYGNKSYIGQVGLYRNYGSEADVCQISRVSSGSEGTDDEKTINYMLSRGHESPFEFITLLFRVECPIFVARQWMRHRIGSYMEMSARKRTMIEYSLPPEVEGCDEITDQVIKKYSEMIGDGVVKEKARAILPLAMRTEFYWQVNFRALLNFLKLRMAPAAQDEIRNYAWAIHSMVSVEYPIIMKSANKHVLGIIDPEEKAVDHASWESGFAKIVARETIKMVHEEKTSSDIMNMIGDLVYLAAHNGFVDGHQKNLYFDEHLATYDTPLGQKVYKDNYTHGKKHREEGR